MLRNLAVSIIFLSLFLGSQALAGDLEGLVLYLPFDEGSGDVAKDASGNGNDGEITGAKWAAGKIGKALEFDGASFVEVPSSDSLESLEEEMTIAAWINPQLSGSAWQGIITKGDDAMEHFEMLVNVDGHVHTAQMFEAGRLWVDRPAGVISAGEWQHLAVTYKPGEWAFYHNGELLDANTGATTNLIPDGKPVVIGDERPMNRLFEGLIDEVAVFNIAISAEEVQLVMGGIGDILSVEPLGKITTTWADVKQ
jgi:hypothetical protein